MHPVYAFGVHLCGGTKSTLRTFLRFLLIGSFFSTVEEFLTVLVLRQDLGSYLFTLFLLFPGFLSFVWFTSRLLRRIVPFRPRYELLHFFIYGVLGLLIEWFVIGLAPWSDPQANPILMLIFQLGMFSFWATVAFAPLLFTNDDPTSRQTRRGLLRFYVPYVLVTYAAAFLAPADLKFAVIIGLIVLGYAFLNVFYARYFVHAFRGSI